MRARAGDRRNTPPPRRPSFLFVPAIVTSQRFGRGTAPALSATQGRYHVARIHGGSGGGSPRPGPMLRHRRGKLGVEGGRSAPLPDRDVQQSVGWLTHLKGREPALATAASEAVVVGRLRLADSFQWLTRDGRSVAPVHPAAEVPRRVEDGHGAGWNLHRFPGSRVAGRAGLAEPHLEGAEAPGLKCGRRARARPTQRRGMPRPPTRNPSW